MNNNILRKIIFCLFIPILLATISTPIIYSDCMDPPGCAHGWSCSWCPSLDPPRNCCLENQNCGDCNKQDCNCAANENCVSITTQCCNCANTEGAKECKPVPEFTVITAIIGIIIVFGGTILMVIKRK